MFELTVVEQVQLYTLLGGLLTWLTVWLVKRRPAWDTTPVIYVLTILGGVLTQATVILQAGGDLNWVSLLLTVGMSVYTGASSVGINEYKKALRNTNQQEDDDGRL